MQTWHAWHGRHALLTRAVLARGPLARAADSLIYELNDHSGLGHLKVAELATFMDTLGHGVAVGELEQMMHELGIDEDADVRLARIAGGRFMAHRVEGRAAIHGASRGGTRGDGCTV